MGSRYKTEETKNIIIDNIKTKPELSITFFVPDKKKEGGEYVTVKGNIRRIDEVEKVIYLANNMKISIDALSHIDGELFE